MTTRDKIRMKFIEERNAEIKKLEAQIASLQERIDELKEDNEYALKRMGTN